MVIHLLRLNVLKYVNPCSHYAIHSVDIQFPLPRQDSAFFVQLNTVPASIVPFQPLSCYLIAHLAVYSA